MESAWNSPGHNTGVPFPPLGDLPNLGIEPRSLTLQADSLPAEPQGEPMYVPARHKLMYDHRFPYGVSAFFNKVGTGDSHWETLAGKGSVIGVGT